MQSHVPRAVGVLFVLVLFVQLLAAGSLMAAAPPPGFSDALVTNLDNPTALAFTPDGRLLITQQTGQLRVYAGGALLATPALDLTIGDKSATTPAPSVGCLAWRSIRSSAQITRFTYITPSRNLASAQ